MDTAFKTHKETTFGWLQMVLELVAAHRARATVRRARRAVAVIAPPPTATRRYLAPR